MSTANPTFASLLIGSEDDPQGAGGAAPSETVGLDPAGRYDSAARRVDDRRAAFRGNHRCRQAES